MAQYILLTIDVEDWFQVENFKQYISFSSWPSRELRVEKNTHRILDLLDSQSVQQRKDTETENQPSFRRKRIALSPLHPRPPRLSENDGGQAGAKKAKEKTQKTSKSCLTKLKATFFILGWIAERLPSLVREIHARGHEVASHGYFHNLCSECSTEALKEDLTKSKKLLEDIIGEAVFGYRAPSFSINHDILQIIRDCGYLYDSSYNSFAIHGRYGKINISENGKQGIVLPIYDVQNREPGTLNRETHILYELPISNLHFRMPFSFACPVKFFRKDSKVYPVELKGRSGGQDLTGELSALSLEQNKYGFVLPWGGGGYFRLTPFPLFKLGVNSILKKNHAYVFYFHPWELDPEQPKVRNASPSYKFRHYTNLSKTRAKLLELIQNFTHCNFITCSQYVNKVMKSAL